MGDGVNNKTHVCGKPQGLLEQVGNCGSHDSMIRPAVLVTNGHF